MTEKEREKHINLLVVQTDKHLETSTQHHFIAIRDFSRLASQQINNHKGRKYVCYRCFQTFYTENEERTRKECTNLQNHVKTCEREKIQKVEYPSRAVDKIMHFKAVAKQLRAPFVAYADFECLLVQDEERMKKVNTKTGIVEEKETKNEEEEDEEKDDQRKKREAFRKHIPASYAYKIIGPNKDYDKDVVLYVPKETDIAKSEMHTAEHFIDSISAEAETLWTKYIKKEVPMRSLTKEEQRAFHRNNICHICKEEIKEGEKKIKEHCHITGNYRGMSHNQCNLDYRIVKHNWKLICLFHNLRRYDAHLIIKAVQKRHGEVKIIPVNMETYVSFTINRVCFIDSAAFAPMSLENLVKDTLKEGDFVYTDKEATAIEELKKYARKKGIFPYDFFDNINKLKVKKIPLMQVFDDTLSDEPCTEEKYKRAKKVWKYCNTFKEYHDFYLKCDVLLLTDFMEKFRKNCLDNFDLDPMHYVSLPGWSWDAALKKSKVQLELIDNAEMYSFFESVIRGGISQVTKRFSKANNKYMKIYDKTKPNIFLMYLDANNLYGDSMKGKLPTKNFAWVEEEEEKERLSQKEEILKLEDDAGVGYAYEIDGKYPEELHDFHADLPLLPERLEIDERMFTDFMKEMWPQEDKKGGVRLTPNLYDKKNYIVHYKQLKFALRHGFVLTKVHRILSFEQNSWLKTYIEFNTEKRKEAANEKNEFGVLLYKLANNVIFGKSVENLRDRMKVRIASDKHMARKLVAKSSFKRHSIIRPDLVVVQCAIENLQLNRPIYTGFTILETSKLKMYEFFYDYIKPKYGTKANLLFMNTDSFLMEIEKDDHDGDVYRDMIEDAEHYDFSEYPPDCPQFKGLTKEHIEDLQTRNRKVVGKMKDETHSRPITGFVGLRPKSYALQIEGKVKDNVVKSTKMQEKQADKGVKEKIK